MSDSLPQFWMEPKQFHPLGNVGSNSEFPAKNYKEEGFEGLNMTCTFAPKTIALTFTAKSIMFC